MIIVSGKIYLRSGSRDAFLASSTEFIVAARKAHGCQDFIVAADPIEVNRVNVYEEWDSETDLLAFRSGGPDQDLTSVIEGASVKRHEILSSGPA
jgi:quinol monooxygenase YgiN